MFNKARYTLSGQFSRSACLLNQRALFSKQKIIYLQLNICSTQTGSRGLLSLQLSVTMAKMPDRKDFECGAIIGTIRGGYSISERAALLGFPCTMVSGDYGEWCKEQKHPVNGISLVKNTMSKTQVRGEWSDLVMGCRVTSTSTQLIYP